MKRSAMIDGNDQVVDESSPKMEFQDTVSLDPGLAITNNGTIKRPLEQGWPSSHARWGEEKDND